ncbi:hypothetical protein B0A48_16772 [Cryoendolithus antarcticus]|uniref:Zinc finger PHD-type domain-containing protein n=1 Tax=Cryoendolithus antarcticus TaxID=1507870 RepID=A0A1V8SE46_9PEZI|nr:hypothetical protein B0A48_16772 [Cryoendolithus antarcticus]
MASTTAGSIVNCPCLEIDQEDPRKYVQCSICSTWQHLLCMGLPLRNSDLPDRYYCHICQPTEHPLLMTCTEAGKMAELVEMRNERATMRGSGGVGGRLKREWMVMECLRLVSRVPNVETHWAAFFTGDPSCLATNDDADATITLLEDLSRAVQNAVRYLALPVLEQLRADLVRRLHQSEVEQVQVLWCLREKLNRGIMVRIRNQQGQEAVAMVRRYFDL